MEKVLKTDGGYFDGERREYVITEMYPRRRLYNFLWSEQTVCRCDQFGSGYSWTKSGTRRRDIESGERNVYVKDRATGEIYSANRNYGKLPFSAFECRVGFGYHKVISEYKGLNTQFTTLVPHNGAAVNFRVVLKNNSPETKNFDMFFVVSPKPALSWHDAYGADAKDDDINGLIFTHDGFRISEPLKALFLSSDRAFSSFETSGKRFFGEYGDCSCPSELNHSSLANLGCNFESDHVAALQFAITLGAGEEYEAYFCAGAARNAEECREISKNNSGKEHFVRELSYQAANAEKYIGTFRLSSPDAYLDEQVDIWLKRQIALGKTWGRLYGKGFRDVMQDITSFVSFDLPLAKERLKEALAHQYEDGNPIRMYEPEFYYPYNDGGAWIPCAVLSYLDESGDLALLDEKIPYLKGDSYKKADLADAFSSGDYDGTSRKESVFDHVKAAMDYLLGCTGAHGLVLFRGGDWNDSLNNAGLQLKGESVWLSIATVKALNEFIKILRYAAKDSLAVKYVEKRDVLKAAVMQYGFEGDRFIYGFNDLGEKIGSEDSAQAKIYLNPQTWAVLADVADKPTLEKVMNTVEKSLKCNYGYVQCKPSYTEGDPNIGRVSYFKPGLVENGGVYNHGVAFKIVADCMLGKADDAYRSLKLISCDNPELCDCGVEPYAVTNMYIGPENAFNAAFAPLNWITGTAGWLYRAVTEYICGVRAEIDGLRVCPCMPEKWKEITVRRKFRGADYTISVRRGIGTNKFDGKPLDGCVLPVCSVGTAHDAIIYIG